MADNNAANPNAQLLDALLGVDGNLHSGAPITLGSSYPYHPCMNKFLDDNNLTYSEESLTLWGMAKEVARLANGGALPDTVPCVFAGEYGHAATGDADDTASNAHIHLAAPRNTPGGPALHAYPTGYTPAGTVLGRDSAPNAIVAWVAFLSSSAPLTLAGFVSMSDVPSDCRAMGRAALDQFTHEVIALTAMYQAKGLNKQNISNRCRQVGYKVNFKQLDALFTSAASRVGLLMENRRVKAAADQDKFFKYHTTAVATPALVIRANEIFPGSFAGLVTNGQLEAAREALANAHLSTAADVITNRTKQITYVALQAVDALPEDWYQGEKAMAESDPVEMKAIKGLFVASSKAKSYALVCQRAQQANPELLARAFEMMAITDFGQKNEAIARLTADLDAWERQAEEAGNA
jgi:hypothetical protein